MRRQSASRALGLDLLAVLVLLIAPLAWFNQTLWPGLSGRTLLSVDILYSFEPWRSLHPDVTAHNALLGDLVLQTGPWRTHITDALAAGELPLWNPKILSGIAFLGAAQPGTLYPLSIPFLLLPLVDAYGWYTAVHVALAGLGMYAFGRALHLRVVAALYAAVAYMFSGFVIVYAVSPQMLGVAAWLPATLAVTELLLREAQTALSRPLVGLAWVGGVLVVGTQFLAGHPEMSAYLTLTVAAYAGLRALSIALRPADGRRNGAQLIRLVRAIGSVAALLMLGAGLAAVQLVPTAEAQASSIRQGARTLSDVLGYAWPLPQLWTLLLPDLFGNPSHHQWLDIWAGQWKPVVLDGQGQPTDTIFWGVKNYVEGAQYVGVLSWLLAAAALLASIVPLLPVQLRADLLPGRPAGVGTLRARACAGRMVLPSARPMPSECSPMSSERVTCLGSAASRGSRRRPLCRPAGCTSTQCRLPRTVEPASSSSAGASRTRRPAPPGWRRWPDWRRSRLDRASPATGRC